MTTELIIRYSELATLTDCQLKHKLTYASGLATPPGRRLVLGSAYHALMQGHYEAFRDADTQKHPRDLNEARKKAGQRLSEYKRGEGIEHVDAEMLEQLRWMYAGYVDRYGTESDMDRFIVIDEKRIVPMMTWKGIKVLLQTTADLIGHHRVWDRWLLLDHKTSGRGDASKDAFSKENQLDPQRALYAASFSLFGPKRGRVPIFGAYHNVIRIDQLKREMSMEERFGRNAVFYNEKELLAVWEEAKIVARKAVEIHLGLGTIYSSPDPSVCSWKCPYTQVHLTARATGRDIVSVALDYGAKRAPDYQSLSERKSGVS